MTNKFRRGFKTEAEDYALEFRLELGLEKHEPICPKKLAHHLEIPIINLSKCDKIDKDIVEYWKHSEDTFSGMIINDGTYKEILLNDFHHPHRQNSTLAHELSHIILGHELKAIFANDGQRVFPSTDENEARWLSGAILFPKKAAIYCEIQRFSLASIRDKYGISEKMIVWRTQVTDAVAAAKNIIKKHGH